MKKLESKTVRELIALAREWGVSGYSRLKKSELVKLLAKNLPKKARTGQTSGKKKAAEKKGPATSNAARSKPKVAVTSSAKKKATPLARARDAGKSASKKARAAASKARLDKPSAAPAPATPETTKIQSEPPPDAPAAPPLDDAGRMGLLAQDPHWLYCFWDLTARQGQMLWTSDAAVLRVLREEAGREEEVQRIALPPNARSWYIHVKEAGSAYRCELGVKLEGDAFSALLGSNLSTTPPVFLAASAASTAAPRYTPPAVQSRATPPVASTSAPSDALPIDDATRQFFFDQSLAPDLRPTDSAAMLQDRAAAGLPHPAGAGAGQSSPGLSWVGGLPSSPGQGFLAWAAEAGPGQDADKGHWLIVDADLIIYGATVAGSRVRLADLEMPVDAHGHFRGRFALSDGLFEFPVQGISPDGTMERRFLLRVKRETEG